MACSRVRGLRMGIDQMTTEAGIEQLMQDLKAVVGDAEALLAATAGAVGERVADARRRAGESLEQARARLGTLERELGTRARAAAGDVEDYVRDNPWQTIAAAAALGLLVGVLVSRRRA